MMSSGMLGWALARLSTAARGKEAFQQQKQKRTKKTLPNNPGPNNSKNKSNDNKVIILEIIWTTRDHTASRSKHTHPQDFLGTENQTRSSFLQLIQLQESCARREKVMLDSSVRGRSEVVGSMGEVHIHQGLLMVGSSHCSQRISPVLGALAGPRLPLPRPSTRSWC